MEPMTFTFEEMIGNFELAGTAAIFEGTVPGPPLDTVDPTNGTRTVRVGQDWWVLARWTCTGWMNNAIGGTWHVRVFFEQMGVGEFALMPGGPVSVPFVSADPHTYVRDIPFPATSMSVPAGLYKPTLSITMSGPGGVALPIAAVAEGPVIQFYDVGP
jgi:hypothetical protein